MNIASILRHWFTLLATLLTGWLLLPAEQQAELSKALGDLIAPLTIIITLIVTAAWRVALTWLGKFLGHGTGEKEGGASGGTLLFWVVCTAAALGGLPSCSPGMPVDIGVQGPGFQGSYSAKGGLRVNAVLPEK